MLNVNILEDNYDGVKEEKVARDKSIKIKNYYHKKNPKSIEYYKNKETEPKKMNGNIMELKPKSSRRKPKNKIVKSLAVKPKQNKIIEKYAMSLINNLNKSNYILEYNKGGQKINVYKDYTLDINMNEITTVNIRAFIFSFELKNIDDKINYNEFKNKYYAQLNQFKDFNPKEQFIDTISYYHSKILENPITKNSMKNFNVRLMSSLRKPSKQNMGYVKKISQIYTQWIEEVKELFYIEQVENKLNLKSYEQSFPLARSMNRKFYIFIGKTNSGKTYTAMNELAKAKSGVYLAPLRLMAQEGQESLWERNVITDLITGEEQKKFDGSSHVSSTIEMCSMTKPIETAIIDEIQMIADDSRGWAWTQALIGVPAKNVILVGSEECLPFVLPIIKNLGEEYEIQRFERKTPLHIHSGIHKIKELKSGDCVVVFSRKNALEMKNSIESSGKKCSVIYGNLSPDVRRTEAQKFKSGENPILVATDAIGMGLNLPINRIFFSTLEKYDGIENRYLNVTEVKQIAGRAGRYGFSEFGEVGLLMNDSYEDNHYLQKAVFGAYDTFEDTRVPISPNLIQIETICETIGKNDLYAALIFFKEKMVKNHNLYKTANLESMIEIALSIKNIDLDITTGLNYSCVPIDVNNYAHMQTFYKWINLHLANKQVNCPKLPDFISPENNNVHDSYLLHEAENYVKLCMAYRWLHYKYPNTYIDIENVIDNATLTNNFIENTLHHYVVINQDKNFRRSRK